MKKNGAVLLAILIATLLSFAVNAQVRNLPLPNRSASLVDDASAVDINPGGLGLIKGSHILYQYSRLQRTNGSGHRFFWAGNLLKVFTASMGYTFFNPGDRPDQVLAFPNPPSASSGFPLNPYSLLSVGLGLNSEKKVGLGFSYHRLFPKQNSDMESAEFWDIGMLIRPHDKLSAGFSITNLNQPVLKKDVQERTWFDFSFGVRPWSDYITLAADIMYSPHHQEVEPHYTLRVDPMPGLQIVGYVDNRLAHSVGINFDLSHLGIGSFARLSEKKGLLDYSVHMRMSKEFFPSISGDGQRKRKPLSLAVIHLKDDYEYKKYAGQFSFSLGEDYLQLLLTLDKISKDRQIGGVFLKIDKLSMGLARIEEVKRLLEKINRQGKMTIAYLKEGSDSDYYLAISCKKILVHPAGSFFINGFSQEMIFLNQGLEKLGVKAQFVRRGKYKNAPDMFTRKKASPEQLEVSKSIVDDIQGRLVNQIIHHRKIAKPVIEKMMALGIQAPAQMLKSGLADQAFMEMELESGLEKVLHRPVLMVTDYEERIYKERQWAPWPRIALVYLDAPIVSGRSHESPFGFGNTVGADTIAEILSEIRLNPEIKGVILRIDSPGGSALASDEMWEQVDITRRVKPVVVSMGDVAASGGYYVASAADFILAEPSTITGSIGIFGGKLSLNNLLEKLGINTEVIKDTASADIFSPFRPFNQKELEEMQKHIDVGYHRFLDQVARGRSLKKEKVAQIAEGRVWTGRQAKEIGLVDKMGGIIDAIEMVKVRLNVPTHRQVALSIYPRGSYLKKMMEQFTEKDQAFFPGWSKKFPHISFFTRVSAGENLAILPYIFYLR